VLGVEHLHLDPPPATPARRPALRAQRADDVTGRTRWTAAPPGRPPSGCRRSTRGRRDDEPSPTSCGSRTTPVTSRRRRALCDDVRAGRPRVGRAPAGALAPSAGRGQLSGTTRSQAPWRRASRGSRAPAVEQEAGRPPVQPVDGHLQPGRREPVQGVQQRAVTADGHERVGLLDGDPAPAPGQLLERGLCGSCRARQDREAGSGRQTGGGRRVEGRSHRLGLPRSGRSSPPHRQGGLGRARPLTPSTLEEPPLRTDDSHVLAQAVHDLGAALWFGGAVMGVAGVNKAATTCATRSTRCGWPSRRGSASPPAEWAGIAAVLVAGSQLTRASTGRLATSTAGPAPAGPRQPWPWPAPARRPSPPTAARRSGSSRSRRQRPAGPSTCRTPRRRTRRRPRARRVAAAPAGVAVPRPVAQRRELVLNSYLVQTYRPGATARGVVRTLLRG
jgi:hypothetical protein